MCCLLYYYSLSICYSLFVTGCALRSLLFYLIYRVTESVSVPVKRDSTIYLVTLSKKKVLLKIYIYITLIFSFFILAICYYHLILELMWNCSIKNSISFSLKSLLGVKMNHHQNKTKQVVPCYILKSEIQIPITSTITQTVTLY